jgi:hypothetical protein
LFSSPIRAFLFEKSSENALISDWSLALPMPPCDPMNRGLSGKPYFFVVKVVSDVGLERRFSLRSDNDYLLLMPSETASSLLILFFFLFLLFF